MCYPLYNLLPDVCFKFSYYVCFSPRELSKICHFFVLFCQRILCTWNKSSRILSHHAFLKQRTVLFRNILYMDNLSTVKSHDFTMRDVKIRTKKLRDILKIKYSTLKIIFWEHTRLRVRGWGSPPLALFCAQIFKSY
jgi:hypothetical protein